MGTIYIIRKAGVPVALADAAGRADALRLFVESLDVSASVASTRDVLAHRALPLLQHVEPRVSPAPKKAAEGETHMLVSARWVINNSPAPKKAAEGETDTLTGDMFGEPAEVAAATAVCDPVQVDAAGKLAGVPEVAAERPGEPQPVLATSAPAPEGRAHSSPTAEATADVHASTGGAQSPDAASAAAEPPASTAADELAAARLARLARTARMSDAYHAGHDAGRRGDGRFASVVEITDRLCEGMSDDQYDEVREEARRGFDAGAASRAQVLKARNTRVPVKYRDPQTGSTWSGRGLKPRWLAEALAAGRSLEAFAVDAKA